MPDKTQRIKEDVKEAIAELLEQVTDEQGVERRPGAKIGGTKIPWTRTDVEKAFPPVTFTPEDTIPVTWNGIAYYLVTDQEVTVPKCIKDIYDDYRRRVRQQGRGVMTSHGWMPVLGIGPLEPERR